MSFLPSPHQVDLTKLRFEKLLPGWNVCSFDCTEADGSDPGGLQEFIQKEALTFQVEKLGVTYLVFHKNDIVAFLTVSMIQILAGHPTTPMGLAFHFIQQMVVGLCVGLAIGKLAMEVVNRVRLESEGLCPVITTSA